MDGSYGHGVGAERCGQSIVNKSLLVAVDLADLADRHCTDPNETSESREACSEMDH